MSETPPNVSESSNIDNISNPDKEIDEEIIDEVHFLLDTNIIINILKQPDRIEKLKLNLKYKKSIIHIPIVVLDEFIQHLQNKETLNSEIDLIITTLFKHGFKYLNELSDANRKHIMNKIEYEDLKLPLEKIFEKIGRIVFDSRNHERTKRAQDFKNKTIKDGKYFKESGEPLKERDCILLKFYLDNPLWHLFTGDKILENVACDEGDIIGKNPSMVHYLSFKN